MLSLWPRSMSLCLYLSLGSSDGANSRMKIMNHGHAVLQAKVQLIGKDFSGCC